MTVRVIYCCACQKDTAAVLRTGGDIYPRRPDLAALPFWQCPDCQCYVGCHHKTEAPTTPLGVIPTPEIREARKKIHALIDPLWQSRRMRRGTLYRKMGDKMGWGPRKFHTSDTRTIDECRAAYRAGLMIKREIET